jgi:signal transduction histidine kinase
LLFLSTGILQAAVVVTAETSNVWLGRSLEIILDARQEIEIQELARGLYDDRMFRVDRDVPTFGYGNRDLYWARFQLHNPTDLAIPLFLVARYAPLDRLTLFSATADGSWSEITLGDQVAFEKRPFPYRFPIFPIMLEPGTSTYYLKLQTGSSALFPLSLSTKDQFIRHEATETMLLGMVFGSMIVMMFYNLFVYFKFRSRAYLLYVVYIFNFLIFSLTYQGLLQQFIFPKADGATALNTFLMLCVDLLFLMTVTFSIEFLELKFRSLRVYRVSRTLQCIGLLNLANTLFFGYYAAQITIASSFMISIYLIAVGLYMSTRFRPARYYTMAWMVILIGNMILILAGSGRIPWNLFTSWGQFVGAALEMLLLSLALGDRVALIQEERSAIQKKLGLVLQNRVMLVSELAHKMNNPLNYISTSAGILRQNQRKFEGLMQALQEDLGAEEGQMVNHLNADNLDLLATIDSATRKSALCIAEIRSLTGLDGFHKERITMENLLDAARLRIQESLGERSLQALDKAADAPLKEAIFMNLFAFSLTFELIFRFWYKHADRSGAMGVHIAGNGAESLTLSMVMADPGHTILGELNATLVPQLSDLLLPYDCRLGANTHENHTHVVFTFLKSRSLSGAVAGNDAHKLQAA